MHDQVGKGDSASVLCAPLFSSSYGSGRVDLLIMNKYIIIYVCLCIEVQRCFVNFYLYNIPCYFLKIIPCTRLRYIISQIVRRLAKVVDCLSQAAGYYPSL